jgi:hypothetical protein
MGIHSEISEDAVSYEWRKSRLSDIMQLMYWVQGIVWISRLVF